MKPLRWILCISLLVASCAVTTLAADDPPGRVARLDYMTGSVSIQPGGVDDWVAAAINRPLTTADRIWTDKESRAELQLGAGALRLSNETSLTLTNVSDNAVQLELDQGVLNLRVVELFPGEVYEIDTPNMAFTILKPGSYRFDVDAEGDTSSVTVWKGEGEATGDGPAQRVRSGDRARFSNGRSLQHYFGAAPPLDGFDDWCQVRDQRTDHVASARYVSRGVVGYEDLDDYGYWSTIPPYGPIWRPYRVAAGWAPYRYGHWIWLQPWGWTWVDDAPWGYAPFHYGRWVYYGSSWCWAPGPYYARPIWAPALVGWFGGPRWGVSIGLGYGVGWFPLGWGEPFFPFYGHSRGYFRNVNIVNTHITNINVINNYYGGRNIENVHYAYRDRVNAVTAVGSDTFVHSRPVQGNTFAVQEKQLRGAQLMANNGVSPTRDSVLGPNGGRHAEAPPSRVLNRPVVSRMEPPARPAPFAGRNEGAGAAPGREAVAAAPGRVPNAAPPSRTQDARAPEGMRPAEPAGRQNDGRGVPIAPRSAQADANVRGNEPGAGGRVVHRPPAEGNVADAARPEASRPDVPARQVGPRTAPGERTIQQQHAVPRPPSQPRDTAPATEARGPERQAPPSREAVPRPSTNPAPERQAAPPAREAVPRPNGNPAPERQAAPPSRERQPAPPQNERQAPQRERQAAPPPQAFNRSVPRPSQDWVAQQRSQPSAYAMESQRAQNYSAPQWQSRRAAPEWHPAPTQSYRSAPSQSYRSAPSMAYRAPSTGSYGGGRSSAPSYSYRGGGGSGGHSGGGGGHGRGH